MADGRADAGLPGLYLTQQGGAFSFEYALIDGVNDGPEHAAELIRLLKGTGSHVNLIP
jgi:23S rRNA (adenine2503-C2)-methyltransferase